MNCTDIEYIWLSRIHSGFTYRRKPGPFPDSAAIGLDFNVARKRKTKLDLSLLTNGVVLDINKFAQTLFKSVKFLVADIVEYNFDTGMDNDKQRYLFTNRLFQKIGLLKKYEDEVFSLPVAKAFNLSGMSEVFSRPYTNLSEFSVKYTLLGRDGIHEDEAPSESVHADQDGESDHVDEAKKGTAVESLYPRCEAIGLDLYIRHTDTPKQKLDATLLTNKVIFEVLRFAKMVCGTKRQIFAEVLKHNFDIDAYEGCIWDTIVRITRSDVRPEAKRAFRKMPCVFVKKTRDQNRGWRRRWVSDFDSQALTEPGKRKRKPKYDDSFCDLEHLEHLPHDDLKDFGKLDSEVDGMQETHAGEQSDASFGPVVPNSPRGDGEAVSGTFSEDMSSGIEVAGEKRRLWKLRAKRTKQILAMWFKNRRNNLDYNVGCGVKQNSIQQNLRLLTNDMVQDTFKFAVHMGRTQSKFMLEIFKRHFMFDIRGPSQRSFLVHMGTQMKTLNSHPLRKSAKLLNAVVNLPGPCSMVDNISSSPAAEAVTLSSATCHEPNMEHYPFCMELGLNLWAVKDHPLKAKLDLCRLTNGALLEMYSFVKKLCGTVLEIMYDVLEHNFHFNAQDGQIAQLLHKWCRLQRTPKAAKGSWVIEKQKKIVQAITKITKEHAPECNGTPRQYPLCKGMRIHLEVNSKREARAKLDLQVLTRAVVYEIHRYVEENPQEDHYVPALYKILEDNFDLSSQLHRRCEFAMAIASQVKTMARNFSSVSRTVDYLNKVFELPFEFPSSGQSVCKEEPEDGYWESDDDDDIEFVCQLIPVDIEVTLD